MAFRAILPKPIKESDFEGIFKRGAREVKNQVVEAFETETRNWRSSPQFTGVVATTNWNYIIQVQTNSLIFLWVDQGTEPHIIRPVRAKMLHWIDKETGEDVWAKEVHHPGSKGRHITEMLMNRFESWIPAYVQDLIEEAIRESGHGI